MLLGPWLLRVLRLVIVGLGASFLTFIAIDLVPGDPAHAILGEGATTEAISQIHQQLGLDRPLLTRYGDWLIGVVQGDFGRSILLHVPVREVLMQRLPVSLELVLLSTIISLVAAVTIAILSAWRPGGIMDRVFNLVVAIGLGFPNFVLALLAVAVFAVSLRLLPASGFVSMRESLGGNLQSMLLPALVLAVHTTCLYARVLRRTMFDVLDEPFIDTAQAKGLGRGKLLTKHVLRNSLLGLVTIVGINIGFQMSGAVILESIFGLPGLGQLLVTSVLSKDFPVVQGIVLISAISYVVINTLVDSVYPLIDPRTRDARA